MIYQDLNSGLTYYVEMKNKHNTMNSSSSAKTFIKMQNHLLNYKDRNNSICALVEVIAKKSQNKPWVISIDKAQQLKNERLRRISIDKFYEIITNDSKAFASLCLQLPETINKILSQDSLYSLQNDSVIDELKEKNSNLLLALYQLAFSTYDGF